MGQIKNIKLHIVTDIKVFKKSSKEVIQQKKSRKELKRFQNNRGYMGNRCSNTRFYHMNRIQLQAADLISDVVSKQYQPLGMSKILDHLYLGNLEDSTNMERLRAEGITHIINTVEHNCMVTGMNRSGALAVAYVMVHL